MFWCTNCNGKPCINGPNGETSFRISELAKRINKTVRSSSSMHLMKKATHTINEFRPTFQGQSDRSIRSVNPITKKVGVDKKHNSYARYLARKKGKTICCCVCTQLITKSGTGLAWPTTIPINAVVSQAATGAIGFVGAFTTGGGTAGDIDTITIRSDNCKFVEKIASGYDLVIQGATGGDATPGNTIESNSLKIETINNCQPSLPKSALI